MKKYNRKFKPRRYGRKLKRATKLKFAQGQVRPTRQIRQAYRMSNAIAEKKVWDAASSQVNPATTNSWTTFNLYTDYAVSTGIIQGPGRNQRIGQKIFVRYIKLNMQLQNTSTSTATNTPGFPVRVTAVVPRDANFPANSSNLPNATYTSNWDTSQWTILWDKTYYLSKPSSPGFNKANSVILPKYKFKIMNSWLFHSANGIIPQECTPMIAVYYGPVEPNTVNPLSFYYDIRVTYTDS